jgi:hypothetical protein
MMETIAMDLLQAYITQKRLFFTAYRSARVVPPLSRIRKSNFKAVKRGVGKNRDAKIELYDLANDISEENDVADEFPEMVEQMKKILAEARTESKIFRLF